MQSTVHLFFMISWMQVCRYSFDVQCGHAGWPKAEALEQSLPASSEHTRKLKPKLLGVSRLARYQNKLLHFEWSPPWHYIETYSSQCWHSFCPSVSRFHQNYPLLLVPSPGSGSSSDHCDLSSQTDSNWLSLRLIQNNFRRPGVSRRLGEAPGS